MKRGTKILFLILIIGGAVFAVAFVRAWNELFPSSLPLVVTKAPAGLPSPPEEPSPASDFVPESVPPAAPFTAAVPARPKETANPSQEEEDAGPPERIKEKLREKHTRKDGDPSERRFGRGGFGRHGRDRGVPWPEGSPEETRYQELWGAYEQEFKDLKTRGERVSRSERESLRQKVIEQVKQEFGETAQEPAGTPPENASE